MTVTELLEDFIRRYSGQPDTAGIYFTSAGLDLLGGTSAPYGGNVLTVSLSPGTYAVIRHTDTGRIGLEESMSNIEYTCDISALGLYQEKNWAAPVFQTLATLQSAGAGLAGAELLLHHSVQEPLLQQTVPAALLAADRLRSQPQALARLAVPRSQAAGSVLAAFAGKADVLLLSAPQILEFSYLPFPAAEYKIVLMMTAEKSKKDMTGLFAEAYQTMQSKNPSLVSAAQLTESDAALCQGTLLYPYAKFMVYEQQRITAAIALLRQRQPDLAGFFALLNHSGQELMGLCQKTYKDAASLYTLIRDTGLAAACRILDPGRGVFSIVLSGQVDTFVEKIRAIFLEKAGYPPSFYICSTADSGMQLPLPSKMPK